LRASYARIFKLGPSPIELICSSRMRPWTFDKATVARSEIDIAVL
jgi:hypothetical protein